MGSLCKSKALCCSVVVRTTLILYWQVKAGYFHEYQSIYPTFKVANSCPYEDITCILILQNSVEKHMKMH